MATASTAQLEARSSGLSGGVLLFGLSAPSDLRRSPTADRHLDVNAWRPWCPWGLWVAFYIYFIGLSAGSFLLSTLVFVFSNKRLEPIGRLAVLQAFVSLLTGLASISSTSATWERFWHVIVYPQWNSVLAWEIWFYNFYIVLLVGRTLVPVRGRPG